MRSSEPARQREQSRGRIRAAQGLSKTAHGNVGRSGVVGRGMGQYGGMSLSMWQRESASDDMTKFVVERHSYRSQADPAKPRAI